MNLFGADGSMLQLQLVVISAICCLLSTCLALDIRLPPSIVQSPIKEKIYRPEIEVQLDCVAEGTPEPSYQWMKNGVVLEPPPWNFLYIGKGSVRITQLTALDEGFYQCLATNSYGTAMSNVTFLQRAVLDSYGGGAVIEEKRDLNEGQPFTLKYKPTKCVPPPIYSWSIADDLIGKSQTGIITDKRVQIDEDGNLHFSYLKMSDMQNNRLYKCNVYNPYLDFTRGGSYTELHITPAGGVKQFGPVFAFATQTPAVALEGRNITLRCFFYGYPDPLLTWSKVGGSMPISRYTIVNYNTEFTIWNVQQSDEGDYLCRAVNANGNQAHTIQIDVQVSPVFQSIDQRPHNMNVTEGDTVHILCKVKAEPAASVIWFRNGVPLDSNNMPERMRLASHGKELILSDVCKNCADGSNDLQVIQCNASNGHGYAFGDGYINILEKTEFVDVPMDLEVEYYETFAEFNCSAVSDDSTPVSIRWYHIDRHGDESVVHNVTDRIVLADNGSLLLYVPENATDVWVKLSGTYRCNATNGYSFVVADAKLVPNGLIITPAPQEQVRRGGIVAWWMWWWLWVLIAAILLLILLLICCCCCLLNRHGDTYKVDEKERKNGNDPEKELVDSGFHDYRRPDSEPLKGSRASLVSSKASDDASSLNEYGDIDAGKFTEDGSFIGDYGTDQRPRRARAGEYMA